MEEHTELLIQAMSKEIERLITEVNLLKRRVAILENGDD